MWRGGPKKDSLTKEGEVAGEMWGEGRGGALIGRGGEGGAVFRRAQAKRSTHYYAHLR